MSTIADAVRKNDVLSADGLENALRDIRNVPEGEVRYIANFDLGGQSSDFKRQRVLVDAYLDRKAAKEERKKNISNAVFALIGVIVGSSLPKLLDLIFGV